MKKLLLILLFVPIVSFGQMDYYVSAKGGLNVREAPNANAKKLSTLPYGTFVSIESRTAIKLTINETYKETVSSGISNPLNFKYLNKFIL